MVGYKPIQHIFKVKLKLVLLYLLLYTTTFAQANMASPIWEGTKTGSAFSSKDIAILSEFIHIQIDHDYKTAQFTIEYTIESNISGKQIPLLFYAQDYKDSFLVMLDNQKAAIQDIPEQYTRFFNSPFSDFGSMKSDHDNRSPSDEVRIQWNKNYAGVYRLNGLKYFEADIVKGIHKVSVVYTANAWMDVSGWIREYSFRYSLTPAKFWKSFGSLRIVLEQKGEVRQLSANVGVPIEKSYKAKNSWTFTALPDEYLEFAYTPEVGNLAKALLVIQPLGLSAIAGVLLFFLHLRLSFRYRKKNVDKKYSPVVTFGSVITPLLIFLTFVYSHYVIDYFIGEDASGNHGYQFLVFFFYPIFTAIYWAVLWLLDKLYKRSLMRKR